MRFTEINPNQERIDLLKELISIHQTSVCLKEQELNQEQLLLNSYEAELKELEG
jgi:hypothetical protein